MLEIAEEYSDELGVKDACDAVNISRSTFYRRRKPESANTPKTSERARSNRALTEEERAKILSVLYSERFIDKSPRQVYAALLDEGEYICSVRTMYRILSQEGEVLERRNQKSRSDYKKPELLATDPNMVWSWDITKLKGPEKWTYFHLYVIIDIFSRYVVGWMVAERETAVLAKQLISESFEKQNISEGQLTIHSDRGSSMKSKTVAQLYADLGVCKSLSRPSVSNDNPFSESQFKTLKYCPGFPERFGSVLQARDFCREFFYYYNEQHYHSGLGFLTPTSVHYHEAACIIEKRKVVLEQAYQKNPQRFVNKPPKPAKLPIAVWINPPQEDALETATNNSDSPLVPC